MPSFRLRGWMTDSRAYRQATGASAATAMRIGGAEAKRDG